MVDRMGIEPTTSALRTAPGGPSKSLTCKAKHHVSLHSVTITTTRINTRPSA